MQEEPLSARVERAVELLEDLPGRRRVTVLADADVDGTAAAAVLAKAMHRVGRRFCVVLTRRRDEALVELVRERSPAFLITADLGATLVPRLAGLHVPSVVLDHHEPVGDGDGDGFVHVNPHLVGEDGSTGASGAAVSYRFAEGLLAAHGMDSRDLLSLALLGAWGDRYHGALGDSGLHARLIGEAREAEGFVAWVSWAPDSPSLGLARALAGNLDPVLPVLFDREQKAEQVLQNLGVPAGRHGELDEEERSRLSSWLAAASLEEGADPSLLKQSLAPRPAFTGNGSVLGGWGVDAVALRVDAATRQGKASTALAALLGNPEAWESLQGGLDGFRRGVGGPVVRALEGAVSFSGGHLVRVEEGWMAGPVADRLMAWTRLGRRPVVALGPMDRGLKVSLRARSGTSWRLDRMARSAARSTGGSGGGHRLAAGALVPGDKEAAFLEHLARELKAEGTRMGVGTHDDGSGAA